MNTKKSKGILGITLAFIMITSVFTAITPAPVAAAPITVDGILGAGEWNPAAWPTGDFVGDDPANDPDIHGYDIRQVFAHYDNATNTLYIGLIVDDLPGDLDGDGNPDTLCSILYPDPGDCPGVGPHEHYTLTLISLNGSYPGASLAYSDNTIPAAMVADGDAQYGTDCIEWSLKNADTYIDPLDFCVSFSCGGDYDGPGEDLFQKCLYGKNPPKIAFDYNATDCMELTFNAVVINDSIVNWTWDFGAGASPASDSGTGAFVPETVTYSSCGTKTVKLSACNAAGCDTVIRNDIIVACKPSAFADPDEPCFDPVNGTDITFTGSGAGGTPPYKYSWTFTSPYTGDHDDEAITKVTGVTTNITAYLTVTDKLNCTALYNVSVGPCAGCSLRLYGTFCQGAGDDTAIDPYSKLSPENWPYTDPVGPFHPQHPQAPRKDFITFNPAFLDHNWHPPGSDDDYDELRYDPCSVTQPDVQHPKEKVFKRMWYKKELFKDHTHDGCFTVIIDQWNSKTGRYEPHHAMCLADWNAWTQEYKHSMGYAINESNNVERPYDSPLYADIYGPAIIQEFTYMTLDGATMPIFVQAGSNVLIPMASWDQSGNGIESFDADNDGDRDAVRVESEYTLGIDVDGDGDMDRMDTDDDELSGDESVVLVLSSMRLEIGESLHFFDHNVTLTEIFGAPGNQAVFTISDLEGGGSTRTSENVVFSKDQVRTFYRAVEGGETTFYLKVTSFGATGDSVIFEVGRIFGQTYANIGANPYWNQKAFMVDGVFYNVVAIKTVEDCFKFITIRQKLPKVPIKLYGKDLTVWKPGMILPELPPFNEPHNVLPDVQDTWTIPKNGQEDKIPKVNESRDPLRIDYVWESVEKRYKGELKEIYNETDEHFEYWNLEWFHTKPWQFTEFRLPKGDTYLVTLSWFADEAEITLWDDEPGPVAEYWGERVKFWYEDCSGPLYIDRCDNQTSIRLYGTFGEGAGDPCVPDPHGQGLYPENWPYTDPVGPFHPQHWQAPVKDFMTFNPAFMDHNWGYPGLDYTFCDGLDVQRPREKVFKRMWYEKELFKDHTQDGCFTVIVDKWDSTAKKYVPDHAICLDDWNVIDQETKFKNGWRLNESNNVERPFDSPLFADIYGPAINQEFTYMFLDGATMPILIRRGSNVLIPMASEVSGNGIDSFDADGDGTPDYLRVESEYTLGIDIDGDGRGFDPDGDGPLGLLERMDNDGIELSGDESVVLVLGPKRLGKGQSIQLFDHKVELVEVYGEPGYEAVFNIYNMEAKDPAFGTQFQTVKMKEYVYFQRGATDPIDNKHDDATFYLKVISASADLQVAIIEVGRLFGEPYANIAYNTDWNQKAFMVDGVFYNVVAIKTVEDCIKFITFRQKLPKVDIKLYTKHLETWNPGEILPEMPPFNMEHYILKDVQWKWTTPHSQEDKIGKVIEHVPALNIWYCNESWEERFKGQLMEIYNETDEHFEYWNLEWFHTLPWQYTEFVVPGGHGGYLVTLAWFARQAEITFWDDEVEPVAEYRGERAKFWYDPVWGTRDLYVNRESTGIGAPPYPTSLADYYDSFYFGEGDNQGDMDAVEVITALTDYLDNRGPFAMGLFDKLDMQEYMYDFLETT